MLWSENGQEVTALNAVTNLAPAAAAVICVGTCASFGGIPAGNPNPTGIRSVSEVSGVSTINIPGCPAHPDWVVGTVAQLLAGVVPELDTDGRPKLFFDSETHTIHRNCPRRHREEAESYGIEGLCLREVGCKGPQTQGDCYARQWNNGTNWCIGANAVCLGCTQKGFPDQFTPFFSGKDEDDD